MRGFPNDPVAFAEHGKAKICMPAFLEYKAQNGKPNGPWFVKYPYQRDPGSRRHIFGSSICVAPIVLPQAKHKITLL